MELSDHGIDQLDELLEQVTRTTQRAQNIDEALDALRTGSNGLNPVKELFITELGDVWSELDRRLSDQSAWQDLRDLQETVDDLEEFLHKLYQIVLSPRKVEIETHFDRWLKKLSVDTKLDLMQFLDNADDEDLHRLGSLIESIESVEINNTRLQEHFVYWLGYQLAQLAQLEKEVSILEKKLKHIARVISELSNLADFLQDLGGDIKGYENDLVQLIGEHWLESQYQELTNLRAEQDDPGYNSQEDAVSNDWAGIEQKLGLLEIHLDALKDHERHLVRSFITEQDIWNEETIQNLRICLKSLIETRNRLKNSPELQEAEPSLMKPMIPEVKELWDNRPLLPDPLQSDSLNDYIAKLHEAEEQLDPWLNIYESVTSQLSEMHSHWMQLARKHSIRDAITSLEEIDLKMETLGDIVRVHNKLVESRDNIRQELRQDLSDPEKDVLDAVLGHVGSGQDRVDVVALRASVTYENYAALLIHLAEKEIVRLEVII